MNELSENIERAKKLKLLLEKHAFNSITIEANKPENINSTRSEGNYYRILFKSLDEAERAQLLFRQNDIVYDYSQDKKNYYISIPDWLINTQLDDKEFSFKAITLAPIPVLPAKPKIASSAQGLSLDKKKSPTGSFTKIVKSMVVPSKYMEIMQSNDNIDSNVKRDDSAELAYKLLQNYVNPGSPVKLFKKRHFKNQVNDFLKTHSLNQFHGNNTPSRGQPLGDYIRAFIDFLKEKDIKMTKDSSLLRRIIYLTNHGNASFKNLDNNVIAGAERQHNSPPDVKNPEVLEIINKLKSITTSEAAAYAESILNPSKELKSFVNKKKHTGITSEAENGSSLTPKQ